MSDYLTIAEAREQLRKKGVIVSPAGMYRLIQKGRLPHVRLNRLYVTGLDEFLAERSKASTEPEAATPVPAPTHVAERVPPHMSLMNPKHRRFGTPDPQRRAG